jgi:uncharacterized repeat protein (TIGR03803 family)
MRTIAGALITLAGIVLSFTSAGAAPAETVLYAFTGTDGQSPTTDHLAFNGKGDLFGTTPGGGAASDGTIFRLTPAAPKGSWTEAVIHSFSDTPDGSGPRGGVIFG